MKTILVPIDFSSISTRVLATARDYSQALAARLVLIHISEPEPDFVGFEPGPLTVRASVARDFKEEHRKLEAAKAEAAQGGIEVLALHIQGPFVAKILSEAETHGANLIILGSHGHGALYELLVGSVTSGVLHGARCPVLVVPARP